MTVSLKLNEELNGIELYFAAKPDQEVLTNLKSNSFRWSSSKKCWYSRQSEKSLQIANNLTGSIVNVLNEEVKTTSKNIISLWESTQWTELEVSQAQKDQDNKLIAKEMKAHVKSRFPQVKFSVTSKGWNSVNFDIVSSPFEEKSIYLLSIREYCKNLLNAYKHCYDPSDPYTDYAGSYNFYGHVEIHWNYKQTEVTEQTKNEMNDFDAKFAESEKAEEERKHNEFLEWQQQRELETIEYNKQQEEEKKQVENIYNSINVKELNENNQYFITGSEFADLNKNNTLDQYKEEVSNGKFSLENVKITKEVHFSNEEALNNFSNMLLNDFDFLTGTGGSFTDDNRINTMTDFDNMEKEERTAVKWNLYGVAIYFNNKLQFIVDTQGFSYSRYVGLTENAKSEKSVPVVQTINNEELTKLKDTASLIETISTDVIQELNIQTSWNNESWKEYKETVKTQLSEYDIKLNKGIIQQLEIEPLKVAMYKLLIEVDGIQEQFKNADIHQGEKITLFYISDWGSIVTDRIIFNSAEPSKYAQYDNAIKLTYTPANKRKLYYNHFYSTLLVFKGLHILPDSVLNHVEEKNGMRITRSKFGSTDSKQYDEILNYFQQRDIKPIINTVKPIF
jgi:hypothetical protein